MRVSIPQVFGVHDRGPDEMLFFEFIRSIRGMKTGTWSCRVKLTLSIILPFAWSTRVKKLEGKNMKIVVFLSGVEFNI